MRRTYSPKVATVKATNMSVAGGYTERLRRLPYYLSSSARSRVSMFDHIIMSDLIQDIDSTKGKFSKTIELIGVLLLQIYLVHERVW